MAAPSASSTTNSTALPAFLKQSKAEIKTKFIDLEWQQRHRLLQGTQSSTSTSTSPSPFSRLPSDAVIARNRYMNVEPYASNRIKLKVPEGANDYINASPIQLGRRRYIATQGPKDISVNHFWRMVADIGNGGKGGGGGGERVVIVMLTQTHEAGREKCFQYYPLSAEESPLLIPRDEEIQDDFKAEVHLEGVEEDVGSRCQIRRLRLRTSFGGEGEEMREVEVVHLLFEGWPDFLIPEGDDRAALVELIQLSATLNHNQESGIHNTSNSTPTSTSPTQPNGTTTPSSTEPNPRIIHCSAGVGRSGTFIALDYLLSLLAAGQLDDLPPDKDPVAETVDLLRQQRMMMVQGEQQFQFVYEVLTEKMRARLQAKGQD